MKVTNGNKSSLEARSEQLDKSLANWPEDTRGLGAALSARYQRRIFSLALGSDAARWSFVAMVIEEYGNVKPPSKPRDRVRWQIDDYLRLAEGNHAAAICDALEYIRFSRT